jgi:hypothetical protein
MQKNISGKFCGFACSTSEEVENVSTNQKPVMRSWVWNYSKKIQHFSRNNPAMLKKSENLSDLNKKDRNKHHSSTFINVVKGVFFVVRVTLVPAPLTTFMKGEE